MASTVLACGTETGLFREHFCYSQKYAHPSLTAHSNAQMGGRIFARLLYCLYVQVVNLKFTNVGMDAAKVIKQGRNSDISISAHDYFI